MSYHLLSCIQDLSALVLEVPEIDTALYVLTYVRVCLSVRLSVCKYVLVIELCGYACMRVLWIQCQWHKDRDLEESVYMSRPIGDKPHDIYIIIYMCCTCITKLGLIKTQCSSLPSIYFFDLFHWSGHLYEYSLSAQPIRHTSSGATDYLQIN
jgi:hypothetical protein